MTSGYFDTLPSLLSLLKVTPGHFPFFQRSCQSRLRAALGNTSRTYLLEASLLNENLSLHNKIFEAALKYVATMVHLRA